MRKWPLIVMALVVLGCAGGGVSGGGTGGTGGTGTTGLTGGGRESATVNLPDVPGYIDVYLLPGQGRVPGSITAQIDVIRWLSALGEQAEAALAPDIFLKTDGENIQGRGINSDTGVPNPPYPDSKTFNTLQVTIPQFFVEDVVGNQNAVGGTSASFIDNCEVTAYRGRTVGVQLFMNDSMFTQVGNNMVWDTNAFLTQNSSLATGGKIRGFLSDYLTFDISGVPNKPTMPAGLQFSPESAQANRVWFSGDAYAIGDRNARAVSGSNGLFVFLTPSAYIEGFFRPMDATTRVKSYELKQASPQVIGEIRLITALKGVYRDYSEVLSNLHDFEFILIPKSGDGLKQDIVILKRSAGAIVDMWFGTADFAPSAGPTFRVYPIKNLYPASTVGELRGTLPRADLIGVGGVPINPSAPNWQRAVRGGKFKFNGTPAGISKFSGDFTTLRI